MQGSNGFGFFSSEAAASTPPRNASVRRRAVGSDGKCMAKENLDEETERLQAQHGRGVCYDGCGMDVADGRWKGRKHLMEVYVASPFGHVAPGALTNQ